MMLRNTSLTRRPRPAAPRGRLRQRHEPPTAPDQSSIAYSQTDLTVGTGRGSDARDDRDRASTAGGFYSETATDHKGTQFDSASHLVPWSATRRWIKGFDMAVIGMKVGGIRRAIVPPSLAYGATGSSDGAIPPNAALVFDILLVSVQ